MSSGSLLYVYLKEEACLDLYDPISEILQKEQGGLLTIDGGPVIEEGSMFEIGVYLPIFYCLCFVNEISTDGYVWGSGF